MKPIFLLVSCLLTASVFAQLPIAQPEAAGFDSERLETMRRIVRGFVDDRLHAGIITLVARDGKIVDFQTYGYRDLEKQLPMEKDTICRVYSMSKIITCVATLRLMEEGYFNLEDPVVKYIPELKEMKVLIRTSHQLPVDKIRL